MKKWTLFLSLLFICIVSVAYASEQTTTIMMYMCGTDLQSDCIIDLEEMCDANLSEDIHIVVLAGGAKKWDDRRLQANRLNLLTIENGDFSPVTDWGDASMGDPDTLERFITYVRETYPADREVLVLWDHGGGMGDGVCFDEVHKNDGLTLVEIDEALAAVKDRDTRFHLAMMGYDACLMGGYETAVIASRYADYFIASEEVEPWTGWYYTPWLNALSEDPGMSTADMGRNIIDAYIRGVEKENVAKYTTLSLIDTSAIADLSGDMEIISYYMTQALNNGQLATISRMLGRTYSFGTYDSPNSSWDMYDMADYLTICEQFAPEAVASARRNLEKSVVHSYSSGDVSTSSGLAIYIPYSNRDYFLEDALEGYNVSDYMPNHVSFTKSLAEMMNGSSYVFQASSPESVDVSEATSTPFSLASLLFDLIPGSTYNAESDTTTGTVPDFIAGNPCQVSDVAGNLPDFIAGVAVTHSDSSASSGSSNNPFDFIAGLDTSTAAPENTPSAGSSSIPDFIAGNILTAANVPAFSLTLSTDAIANLSYAEGGLFMDISDDDGVYLLDLGYMRNTWIDWNTNRIYSAFDGNWSYLDGQLVVLYEQSRNEISRRCLVPAKVNDQETYLVVVFDGNNTTGRILGYNDGVDENGLPIRRITPLSQGDVIVPVHRLLYCSWEDWEDPDTDFDETTFDGEPIEWYPDLQVAFDTLKDEGDPSDYMFTFYLNDIFGDSESSDFIEFSM